MRTLLLAAIFLFTSVQAHTTSPSLSMNEVQVVTYVDLEPGKAASGSSLLVKQVQAEKRNVGCQVAFLIKEDGRPNHFMVVERWNTFRDLNALRNSDSYKHFRLRLQPMLASPLDERIGHQVEP